MKLLSLFFICIYVYIYMPPLAPTDVYMYDPSINYPPPSNASLSVVAIVAGGFQEKMRKKNTTGIHRSNGEVGPYARGRCECCARANRLLVCSIMISNPMFGGSHRKIILLCFLRMVR